MKKHYQAIEASLASFPRKTKRDTETPWAYPPQLRVRAEQQQGAIVQGQGGLIFRLGVESLNSKISWLSDGSIQSINILEIANFLASQFCVSGSFLANYSRAPKTSWEKEDSGGYSSGWPPNATDPQTHFFEL